MEFLKTIGNYLNNILFIVGVLVLYFYSKAQAKRNDKTNDEIKALVAATRDEHLKLIEKLSEVLQKFAEEVKNDSAEVRHKQLELTADVHKLTIEMGHLKDDHFESHKNVAELIRTVTNVTHTVERLTADIKELAGVTTGLSKDMAVIQDRVDRNFQKLLSLSKKVRCPNEKNNKKEKRV